MSLAEAPADSSVDEGHVAAPSAALYGILGEVVGVLAADKRFHHFSIADLEWAVLPALISGQYMIARGAVRPKGDAKAPAASLPIGLALWAHVSPEVDQKLRRQMADRSGYRLAPSEWSSGDIVWLLSLSGPASVLPALLDRVKAEAFAAGEFQSHSWAMMRPEIARSKRTAETKTSA